MLKAVVNNQEEIPEVLREFYKPLDEGEGFALEIDLDSQKEIKKKVKEFRDNNIKLQNQIKALEDKLSPYADLDMEEVRVALEERAKVKQEELLPRQEVEKHIATRLQTEKEKYEKELADAQSQAVSYQSELNNMLIEKTITEALNKVGQLQKGALSDVLRRARLSMEIKDGQLIELESGLTLNPTEWASALMRDCPYFFVANTGMNAKGSGLEPPEPNPWKPESVNLTAQGRMFRDDPVKARRLAAEAGVQL